MEVNKNFYYLVRFIAEFHREPKAREVYEGVSVGNYFHRIKKEQAKISEEDKEFLRRIGIDLSIKDPQVLVHEKVSALIEFLQKEGRLPKGKEVYKGIVLKVFLNNVLSGNTSLDQEDSKLLYEALKKASQ